MTEDTHSVLVVTKDSKLSQSIGVMLMPPLFETEVLNDFNEARRRVTERSYNIILVDYAEGEGADFATDASEGLCTILLLTPPSLFEEVSYRVEGYGIIAITSDDASRMEIRTPDSECNPYIVFTLLIYAALDGIKNNLVPPEDVKENLFENATNCSTLPDTLDSAREIAQNSSFIKEALGF